MRWASPWHAQLTCAQCPCCPRPARHARVSARCRCSTGRADAAGACSAGLAFDARSACCALCIRLRSVQTQRAEPSCASVPSLAVVAGRGKTVWLVPRCALVAGTASACCTWWASLAAAAVGHWLRTCVAPCARPTCASVPSRARDTRRAVCVWPAPVCTLCACAVCPCCPCNAGNASCPVHVRLGARLAHLTAATCGGHTANMCWSDRFARDA